MNKPWYCTQCGTENHPNSDRCFECRTPRQPHTYSGDTPPSASHGQPPHDQPSYDQPRKASRVVPVVVTCAILIVVIPIIVLGVAVALPNYIKANVKAREAENKSSLHLIQFRVEQYAVDHDGAYPDYLIGGEACCARSVDTEAESDAFRVILGCSPHSGISDPLLREGYLSAYPVNPFIRNGAALHEIQQYLETASNGCDPLRNACDTGAAHGTRFGSNCTLMGNVLADIRFPQIPGKRGEPFNTGADVEYDYWDLWQGSRPYPFLPGAFFYKSFSPTTYHANAKITEVGPPAPATGYIMGAYGDFKTNGMDVLGEEQPVLGEGGKHLWHMLRSEATTSPMSTEGCPYLFNESDDDQAEPIAGNPNGICDSIVMLLTSYEDSE